MSLKTRSVRRTDVKFTRNPGFGWTWGFSTIEAWVFKSMGEYCRNLREAKKEAFRAIEGKRCFTIKSMRWAAR